MPAACSQRAFWTAAFMRLGLPAFARRWARHSRNCSRSGRFHAEARADATGDGQQIGVMEAVGQTAVPGEDHQEDGAGVQIRAGEQAQFAEHGGVHLLGFIDDQHRPVERSLDLGLPLLPKRFGPVPAVVRGEGHAEEISQFSVEVDHRGLGATEESDHDVPQGAEPIGEDAQRRAFPASRLAADQGEAAFADLVFDPPAEALDGVE